MPDFWRLRNMEGGLLLISNSGTFQRSWAWEVLESNSEVGCGLAFEICCLTMTVLGSSERFAISTRKFFPSVTSATPPHARQR